MQIANHILSKEGILTSFSIAKKIMVRDIKKITVRDIKKFRDGLKNSKMNAKKSQESLRKVIIKEAVESVNTQKIPGLLLNGIFAENEEKKRMMELTYFSSVIAKKLAEKKIDKYHSCYIINAIVNMLGLTEEDFNEFHRKFAKFREGKGEEDEQSE